MTIDERVEDLLHDLADAVIADHRHLDERVEERRRKGVRQQHRLVLGGHAQQRPHQHRLQRHFTLPSKRATMKRAKKSQLRCTS